MTESALTSRIKTPLGRTSMSHGLSAWGHDEQATARASWSRAAGTGAASRAARSPSAWGQGRRLLVAWSVSDLAGPACGLGDPEFPARLLDASEQAMVALGGRRYPADVREHEQVLAEVVAGLGHARFDELRAEGARLPLDAAIRRALGRP